MLLNAIRFLAFIVIIGIVIGGVAGLIFGSFQSVSEPEKAVQGGEADQEQQNPEPESFPDQEEVTMDPTPEESLPPGQMSGQEVASVVLERLGGGSIKKMKLKEKDGRRIYKVEVEGEGIEGKVELDAYTGEILEEEIEYDD